MSKKAVLVCSCSGACPSMVDVNFWELSERIRLEVPNKFMTIHPRLCEENGEELMADLLKEGTKYITVACKEEKQRKLLRDGFQKANIPMNDDTYKPISVSFKNTQSVFEEIKAALEE